MPLCAQRFVVILDSMDNWIIWDCLAGQPVSFDILGVPVRDRPTMECVCRAMEIIHLKADTAKAEVQRPRRTAERAASRAVRKLARSVGAGVAR